MIRFEAAPLAPCGVVNSHGFAFLSLTGGADGVGDGRPSTVGGQDGCGRAVAIDSAQSRRRLDEGFSAALRKAAP